MDPSHVRKYREIDLENLALKQLHRVYPKGFKPPIDIELVAQTHDVIDSFVFIPEIEERCSAAACLYYRPQDDVFDIIVDEDTYLDQRYRANFSIAHEFAHIILHYDLFKDCQDIQDTIELNKRINNVYKDIEDDANRFAGAILMPFTKIKIDTNKAYEGLITEYGFNEQLIPEKIKEILARGYDVSYLAMKIRLIQLNLLNKISTALRRQYHILDDF